MPQTPESKQANGDATMMGEWVKNLAPTDLASEGITAEEAPFVRQALSRAQALRLLASDPGDAYLQGMTDALGYKHLQAIVAAAEIHQSDFSDTPTPSEAA